MSKPTPRVDEVADENPDTPILRMLRGMLKHADIKDYREDYRRYLIEKYR